MSLLKVPMPTNGILTTEYVDMLITTVNALVSTRDWQDGVNADVRESVRIIAERVMALEQQLQANQSSFDMERSHFILQLHAQKIIDRDEARQMLGLPPGERRNPAPFTKDDFAALSDNALLNETIRRMSNDPKTQEVIAKTKQVLAQMKRCEEMDKDLHERLTNARVEENADCIMDCLEQAIEDGELPVDIGAIE